MTLQDRLSTWPETASYVLSLQDYCIIRCFSSKTLNCELKGFILKDTVERYEKDEQWTYFGGTFLIFHNILHIIPHISYHPSYSILSLMFNIIPHVQYYPSYSISFLMLHKKVELTLAVLLASKQSLHKLELRVAWKEFIFGIMVWWEILDDLEMPFKIFCGFSQHGVSSIP